MNVDEIISIDPDICFGKPHIKGIRSKVSFILELISSGWTIDQILDEYDHLSREQVNACLTYAKEIVDIHRSKVEAAHKVQFYYLGVLQISFPHGKFKKRSKINQFYAIPLI